MRLAMSGRRRVPNATTRTPHPNASNGPNRYSCGHRANILDPQLSEIRAAVARSSRGEPY
jgi:hypothetical protein